MALFTTYSHLGKRVKQSVPNYKFREAIEQIEKYTLVPKPEVIRIIKMFFFLVANKMKEGYKVVVPQFGTFFNKPLKRLKAVDPQLKTPMVIGPRFKASFVDSPFLRWYMSPEVWSKYKAYRTRAYFDTVNKYIREYFLDSDYFEKTRPNYEELSQLFDFEEKERKVGPNPITKAWY